MKISERYYNLCGKKSNYIGDFLNKNIDYDGIYVGHECCKIQFAMFLEEFLNKRIELHKQEGMHISLVIPPLSEKNFDEIIEIDKEREFGNLFDEYVCNDLGTISWLNEKFKSPQIRIGRNLEKTNRDVRVNVADGITDEFKSSYFEPIFTDPFWIDFLSKNNVKAFDTETIPNEKMVISKEVPFTIGIHFPDIILSCSHFCEYALDESVPIVQKCTHLCDKYYKRIYLNEKYDTYLFGRTIVAFQYDNDVNEHIFTENSVRIIYGEKIVKGGCTGKNEK